MVPNPYDFEDLVRGVEEEAPEGSELDKLAVAARISDEIRSLGDELMERYVKAAREAGASWSQIGERLQVSKQAAQQRFVEAVSVTEEAVRVPGRIAQRIERALTGRTGPMFDRFTDRARQVLVAAQNAAHGFNHNYLGTEHLLIGLTMDSTSVGAKALAQLKVSPEAVRAQVAEIVGMGTEKPPSDASRPFTPRARKSLELAFKEALQMGHNYIGTEHLLLGLITEREGVAPQILAQSGVTHKTAKEAVLKLLKGYDNGEETAR